jgi:uncharacterized protein DUF1942
LDTTARIARIAGAATIAMTLTANSVAYSAASPLVGSFGVEQHVVAADGSVGGYTVGGVQRDGSDVLNVPLTGQVRLSGELWIAPTAVTAVKGPVVPAVKSFSARTGSGESYPVLVQALAPDLDVSPLSQGQQSTGNLYFDVTGSAPTSVVYRDGETDRVVWTAPR